MAYVITVLRDSTACWSDARSGWDGGVCLTRSACTSGRGRKRGREKERERQTKLEVTESGRERAGEGEEEGEIVLTL